MQDLFRTINQFYALANQKSEADILAELSSLETFTDRVAFAEKHLEHLSSGSSRVIYITPSKDVLKLAKNERGVAQNIAEASPKLKSKFINKTIKADKNGLWKISPLLDKVTEKEFQQMTGFKFKDFGEALSYALKEPDSNSKSKPNDYKRIASSDLFKEIVSCGKKADLVSGDLARISSWGTMNEHPVLLDAGLTRKIYDEFYTSNESPKSSS